MIHSNEFGNNMFLNVAYSCSLQKRDVPVPALIMCSNLQLERHKKGTCVDGRGMNGTAILKAFLLFEYECI